MTKSCALKSIKSLKSLRSLRSLRSLGTLEKNKGTDPESSLCVNQQLYDLLNNYGLSIVFISISYNECKISAFYPRPQSLNIGI